VIILYRQLDRTQHQNAIYDNETITKFVSKLDETNVTCACRAADLTAKCMLIYHNNVLHAIKIPVFEQD